MSDSGTSAAPLSSLPVPPPVRPMLAKRVDGIPHGDRWLFEPKWDGFRTLVFRNGSDVLLQSRDLKPMNRYFPELAAPLLAQLPERCAIDGELVIAGAHGLEFETLQGAHPSGRIAGWRCWPTRPRRRWWSGICSVTATLT